jgi:hypothetical protein
MTYIPTTEEDRIAAAIVDAGYQVHKELGPGLLESAYEECLAFELAERSSKRSNKIHRVHQAQLMTYLKLSGCRIGFLMNFTVPLFRNGIRRVVV